MVRLVSGLLVVLACFFYSPSKADTSQNLIDNNNWNGATYGYDPGGCCASVSGSGALYDYGTNTILYSYGTDVLWQTIAINDALKASGVEVSGFNYGWSFKKVSNNGRDGDTLQFDIQMTDSNGNAVENYSYNYSDSSYAHEQWSVSYTHLTLPTKRIV